MLLDATLVVHRAGVLSVPGAHMHAPIRMFGLSAHTRTQTTQDMPAIGSIMNAHAHALAQAPSSYDWAQGAHTPAMSPWLRI